MEVLVSYIQSDLVRVITPFGCFNGTWCSSNPPHCKKYTVELDSDDVLTPEMVEFSTSAHPCIKCDNEFVCFIGLVEEVQDNIMILRLGRYIMMLELSQDYDFSQYSGYYICVKLRKVNLFDINE